MNTLQEVHPGAVNKRRILSGSHWVSAAAIVIIAAFATLAAIHLRVLAMANLASHSQHLALATEALLIARINTIEVALVAAAADISHQLATHTINSDAITQRLRLIEDNQRWISVVRATNSQGDVLYGRGLPSPTINIADRDYFLRLQGDPTVGMVVASPIKAKQVNEWRWPFVHRINLTDGGFGGIVYIEIPIHHIHPLLEQISNSTGGLVAIRDTNLNLIVRHVAPYGDLLTVGEKLTNVEFTTALAANPKEGNFLSDTLVVDAVHRSYSYRRHNQYGLTVDVGLPTEPVLAQWRHQTWIIAGLAISLAFGLLVLTRRMQSNLCRQCLSIEALEASRKGLLATQLQLNASYAQDISERQKTANELLAIKNMLEAALPSMSDAIFISDAKGQFLHFNLAYATFHKFKSIDECARALKESPLFLDVYTMQGELLPFEQSPTPRAMRGETQSNAKFTLRRKDTGETWGGIYNFAPICNAAGSVIGSVVACRDITEQNAADLLIQQLNTTLELRVAERTAELEMTNQELDAFSYSVSHDLRSPLRAIDGFARKIAAGYGERLDDEGRRCLQVVRDNAQRMGTLIDDLLAFSRMSRSDLSRQQVSMDAMAHQVATELQAAEPQRAIEFTFLPLNQAFGDAAMLRQVWINLLDNAIKFTRTCDIARIEVGSQVEAAETVYWVKDNGAGFDMQYAGKLFGVFQRLHRQDEFEGTGVGLAIVQRILHRHNGRVWAEGHPGVGASLWFALPSV